MKISMMIFLFGGIAIWSIEGTLVQKVGEPQIEDDYYPQKLGGYNQMPLSEANWLLKFIKQDPSNKVKLIKYQKQVVNGYNYKLTFINASGKIQQIYLYEDINGNLSLPISTEPLPTLNDL